MGVLESAQGAFGKAYVFGAGRSGDPNCDCSSYVANVFGANGVSLPAFTDAIAAATPLVGTDLSVAVPGDLLIYKYDDPYQPGTAYPHIAIFAGGNLTYACQFPNGSGAFPVLNLPFEVHRVGGVSAGGGGPVFAGGNPMAGIFGWVRANPLLAGGLAAAVYLLSGPLRNPTGGTWQPDLFGGAGKKREPGKDRADELRRARAEMRDSGSRDLFDFLRPAPSPPRRRPRRNIDAFTGSGGVIHPIRDSKGYDPDVDLIERELKHRRTREAFHRDTPRGAERESGIIRPTAAWARNLSLASLAQIARDAGVSPAREGWWDTAKLSAASSKRTVHVGGHDVTISGGPRRKASGEYQALIREGGHRGDQRRSARRVTSGEPTRRATRAESAYAARAGGGRLADLPF